MTKKKKTWNRILNAIMTVFLALLIILLIFMFIARASGNTFSLFGLSFFRVQSGSMEPTLKIGDVIMVQHTSAENIHKGDIVSYKADEGEMEGNIVTHRVIAEPQPWGDEYILQTQGDANDTQPDPEITSEQLVGKYVTTLWLMGKLYSFFLTPVGLVTLIVIIIGLFGFEMISLLVSYKSLDNKLDDYFDAMIESEEKKGGDSDPPEEKEE